MKLESLQVQNFRAFEDETISFDDYTCLVGPNGTGKSTVLYALRVLFRDTAESSLNLSQLEKEDFNNQSTSKPIMITATFTNLNEEAEKDFADYYRQGKLVITALAQFDSDAGFARVTQHGQRMGMDEFRKFFEAEKQGASVADLKKIYEGIMKQRSDLPSPSTKQNMVNSLRKYEEDHPTLCELIPSEDQFYGFTKGANLLAKYVQWVFVPAVKDASGEQIEAKDTALGKLLARTVREKISFEDSLNELRDRTRENYQKLLGQHQSELEALSTSLSQKIAEWAHPDASLKLEWQQDPEKSVRLDEPFAQVIASEGKFTGNIARFGHGLQRSFLLALLQELSGTDSKKGPTLLLGCEEPELYQHPPQAKHLSNVLQKLSTQNSQIIVTTHSPYFVSGKGFENVRLARKDASNSRVNLKRLTFQELSKIISDTQGDPPADTEGVLAKIHQALQPSLNEIFFTNSLVLVEGLEDLSYITTYMNLMGRSDDVRRSGIHIVPTDSKSKMLQPLAIAKQLEIPTFVVFDADGHLPDRNGNREQHRKNNVALLRLAGVSTPEAFPNEPFWGKNVVMWHTELNQVIAGDFDAADWENYRNQVNAKYGHVGGLNKNTLFIADTLELAWGNGKKSPTLLRLCHEILDFGSPGVMKS